MAEKHRIRTDQFRFTLLPEESAMLTKNAYELGLSKADYLRKIILYGNIIGQHPIMEKSQGRKLLYEVNRIGNNINQIAYNSNSKRSTTNLEWKAVRAECLEILCLLGSMVHMERDELDEWQSRVRQCVEKHRLSLEEEFPEEPQSVDSHGENQGKN